MSGVEPPALRDFDPRAAPAGVTTRIRKVFASTPEGTPAFYPISVIAGAKPGPTAALIAGIHGDEYEGPSALLRLAEAIAPSDLAGRLIIVPFAHLAAFAAGKRESPIDGINLARIFPGDPRGTLTYRLAHDLFETVVRPADFVVDLHSGGVAYAFLPVAGWYAPDDKVLDKTSAASLALARDFQLSWLWRLPARDGVLSCEAVKAGIPATGAEAGGRGGCLDADRVALEKGVRRILAARGMLASETSKLLFAATHYLDGDLEPCPAAGFFEPFVELGAPVSKGDVLARILSPNGDERARLTASQSGIIMALRHLRTVREGEGAVCVAVERSL